jgi:hypothetical protein
MVFCDVTVYYLANMHNHFKSLVLPNSGLFNVILNCSFQVKRRIETLDKKKSWPRVKKTKQECSDDDEDCAAPTCLRPTGNT